MMNRREYLKAMGLGMMALAMPGYLRASERPPSKRPPNIVLIVSDDQGYNDLGCYGSTEVKTPHLDQLAADGARLTSFYVTWPACTPSRGSLLTGRYPQRNGTYDMFRNDKVDQDHLYTPEEYEVSWERVGGMDTREVLIPRVLKSAGYTSGIFGKWDLGMLHRFLPLQRGFDEFYGYVNTGIDYWTHERYGIPSMYRNNEPTTEDKGTYATDLFRREAVRFIEKNKDRPFFCYVPFNAPHGASNLDRPRPGVQAPLEYIRKHYGAYDPNNSDTRQARRLRYMAAVTYMDEAMGEILETLSRNGLEDNTIVIFFSDNGGGGGSDNTPLRGGKGHMFEGGIRVPCIVRWPGVVPEGSVCEEFLTSMEIYPMLCRAAGARPPRSVMLDGFDMTGVLRGKETSRRKEMFWKRRGDKAARVGNFKWVDSARGSGLFDLSNDIGEKHDLSKEKPDVLESLKSRFAAWMKEMAEAEPRGPFKNF
ncbi:MAG: sulfatase-like hydrolase/transferase [Sedimentisphaerales bacterium]|nr:sulfatase-like hydrolase/transferase [Sedimentisphaerales bacterium]